MHWMRWLEAKTRPSPEGQVWELVWAVLLLAALLVHWLNLSSAPHEQSTPHEQPTIRFCKLDATSHQCSGAWVTLPGSPPRK
jgi:hypothetical protein